MSLLQKVSPSLVVLAVSAVGLFCLSDNALLSAYEFSKGLGGVFLAIALMIGGCVIGVAHCGLRAAFLGIAFAALLGLGPSLVMKAKGIPVPSNTSAVIASPTIAQPSPAAAPAQ